MGSRWRWQNAQPVGAKLQPKMRISATKGDDMVSSPSLVLRREHAEERNDEADAEVRHHVLVRLAAADDGDGRPEILRAGVRDVDLHARALAEDGVLRLRVLGEGRVGQ